MITNVLNAAVQLLSVCPADLDIFSIMRAKLVKRALITVSVVAMPIPVLYV